ncbi:MAG TPA: MGMT family protein [Alphaproteobacteria bacterium]|nr:MGMT family protein [Alphaproteobacteria bacterium]
MAITEFQKRVYDFISKVPKGKVVTYNGIARALESAPRAVGQALKRNPNAPVVPCHRVIHENGDIGGYSGVRDSDKKLKMLEDEGVVIINRKVDEKHIIRG